MFVLSIFFISGTVPKWPLDIDYEDLQGLLDLQAAGRQCRNMVLKKPATSCKRPAAATTTTNLATTAGTSHHSDTESSNDSSDESVQLDATDPVDEATVVVGDILLALLKKEVAAATKTD